MRTTLQFTGDWPWWLGLGAAAVLAAAAVYLYQADLRRQAPRLRWVLPGLRALTVALLVLMLSGPVLHHRKLLGHLSRLLLFVDTSRSMSLTDSSMELGRKVRILQHLGLLRADAVPMDLPKAGEALAAGQALARRAGDVTDEAAFQRLRQEFGARADEARTALEHGGATDRLAAFDQEIAQPARALAERALPAIDDRAQAARDLSQLATVLGRWRGEIAARFRKETMETAGASAVSPLNDALRRFDGLSRAQRLQSLLLEGDQASLLHRLAEKHEVTLYAVGEGAAEKVWQSSGRTAAGFGGFGPPAGAATNLSVPLQAVLGNEQAGAEKGAIVLFSDGQHNEGESPLEAAKVLGAREFPVYTVGFGSEVRPHDLAITRVLTPETVFSEDQVQGSVTLKDDMPPGLPFVLAVKDGDRTLWEKKLSTTGENLRVVPFSFPISQPVKERMQAEQKARAGVQLAGLPLELKATVSAVPGDEEPGNNALPLRLRALTQKRRILLIDGRPRWETRYLRNLFERDEQWEIDAVVAGTKGRNIPFGDGAGEFPTDLARLARYDLIFFGDVPASDWRAGELQAIRDFVEKRGGALVFLDGARGELRGYARTPLGPLLPVTWPGAPVTEGLGQPLLAERAQGLAAFALAPEHTQSLEAWRQLPAPHWLSGAKALPGSETLLSVGAPSGPAAAVVLRSFGAGRVLYDALEDTWRWRYEVADQYHTRYWNQMADWLAELPFAVHNKLVSIDAGAVTYRPGETAEIRLRLRDGEGRPVTNAVADAVLFRDGVRLAAIRLTPDENAGGLFHGRTGKLEPGSYEVGVESAALAARDATARTSFKVLPRETGELTELSLNEELLRQVARASGGEYLPEEQAGRLADLLAPLSHGEVIESETVLWQSPWWFALVVLFWTLEWFLRKRAGLL